MHGMQLIMGNGKLRKTRNFKFFYFSFTVTVCERLYMIIVFTYYTEPRYIVYYHIVNTSCTYLNAYGSHAASSCVVFGNDDGFIIIIFDDASITNYQFKTKWCPRESRSVLVFFRRIHWRTPDYLVTGVYGRIDFVQVTVICILYIYFYIILTDVQSL